MVCGIWLYGNTMHEETISTRTVFQGRALTLDVVDVQLPDGRESVREIIRHPGAAVILARRADGAFVFVRQFRKAVEDILLEVVAGTLDPGETPEACARRELREETGYEAESIEALGTVFPAPGYSSEQLHFFLASLKPTPKPPCPDEDEMLETAILSADEIDTLISSGGIVDAKTMVAWMLYRRTI